MIFSLLLLLAACTSTTAPTPPAPERALPTTAPPTLTPAPKPETPTPAPGAVSPLPTPEPERMSTPTLLPKPETVSPTPAPEQPPQLEQPLATRPQPLGIYYGWPSAAVSVGQEGAPPETLFMQFSRVVFGQNLAEPSHPDHVYTKALIKRLRADGVDVYGYVDMGISTRPSPPTLGQLQAEVLAWRTMGASGIFWDDAGYEYAGDLSFQAYRQRLAALVEFTQASGLGVFLNAWDPDDLFAPRGPDGQPAAIAVLRPEDSLLAESWFYSDGAYVDPDDWFGKLQKLAAYRQRAPFLLACVATGDDFAGVEQSKPFLAAYWSAVMAACDFFQFTNAHYSALASQEGNHIYVHELPDLPAGEPFIGAIHRGRAANGMTVFERRTGSGIIRAGSNGRDQGFGEFVGGEPGG